MKKRILCIMLAVFMVTAIIPSGVFASETSGTCGENVTWEIKDGVLTLSGTGAVQDFGICETPWYANQGVNKIVVNEGITYLGDFSIFGTFAREVYLPSTLMGLGRAALKDNPYLEKIIVAEGNAQYHTDSQGALYNTKNQELLYAAGAHEGEFVVNKDVKVLDFDIAFSTSRKITAISVEAGNTAFKADSAGALYTAAGEFLYLPRGFAGEYTVLAPTTEIPAFSMWNINGLTKVTIPEGVTKIWNHAFEGSWQIKEIYLPKTLTYIYDSAFFSCESLTDIYFSGTEAQWNAIEHFDADIEDVYANVTFHFADDTSECEHKEETIPAVDATCTESGLTEGAKCSLCGEILTQQQEVPSSGHSYGEWTETEEEQQRVCALCGDVETKPLEEVVIGDATGDGLINALDATQILRYANGKASALAGIDEEALAEFLDINGDGTVNALDATQILRFANGKASAFDKLLK